MSSISDVLNTTPANSLLFGVMECPDADGTIWKDSILEGTPAGFRMLSQILQEMAQVVEQGESEGWALTLSPEDLPALAAHEVRSLALNCAPMKD